MNNSEVIYTGLKADITDSVPRYLQLQAKALGIVFEGMIIFKLIFSSNRVLLLRLAATIAAGQSNCATPLARPLSHSYSIIARNRSAIDRVVTDEISVYDIVHAAVREQTGLDISRMSSSSSGAIHTPITLHAEQQDRDSHWLCVNLLCERASLEYPPTQVDGSVATSTFWASEKDVQDMDGEDFYLDMKDDILAAFELRRGRDS